MKLTVIVPVYKVEQYIRQCVESIFMQNIPDDDFELLLIDDGNTDNSFGVIKDLTDSHRNVIIIRQENQGLSAARNTGLEKASGDYVLFLDSDDLLVPGSLKPLLRDACQTSCDMAIAGFVKLTDEEIEQEKQVSQAEYKSTKTTGEQIYLKLYTPRECYVWHTLYKREFLQKNNLRFIPGIYFEDVPFTNECYLKAGDCLYTDFVFYVYRQRPGSICSAISKRKVMDFNKVLAHLWQMWLSCDRGKAVKAQLMNTIHTTFSIEMWYVSHVKELYPHRFEIVDDLKQRIPDLHFTGTMKQCVTSFLYRHFPSTYFWLSSHH